MSSLPHVSKNGGKFVFKNQHAYPFAAKYFNTVDDLDKIDWDEIECALGDLQNVNILVLEPTAKYQNVAKRNGVAKLTPARALIGEMIRRYWVLGIECTYLEVQKLGWFLERMIQELGVKDDLHLQFKADKYGPYSDRLRHLLDALSGSYLHCDKRLSDAGPSDKIWFDEGRRPFMEAYLKQESAAPLRLILDHTAERIDGFESPLGMELLSAVDWLIQREGCEPTLPSIREGLQNWLAGPQTAERKLRLFDDQLLKFALERLAPAPVNTEQGA